MAPDDPEETSKVEKISAWIDGELTPEASIQFTEALGRDPTFHLEARETKAAWDLLDHLPKPENNPALTNRTMALLQLRDVQPRAAETDSGVGKPYETRFLPMVAWWAVLAFIFALSFGISSAIISSGNQPNTGNSRYLWLNAASVPADYRNDTEFLKWLVAPERFGTSKP